LPSGTDAATNLMRIQSDAELLLASRGRFQSARGAAGIRTTPGPVYVTIGPRRKPRIHWLFSGKGWMIGLTLFKHR
jgi:hypothetical protein